MAWSLLPTDYTDVTWEGLKKYIQVNNLDGTVSFNDVTAYMNKENSFFGAREANKMNEALNYIMSMLENGTDLYEEFQEYFATQKEQFESSADTMYQDLSQYFVTLKSNADSTFSKIEQDYEDRITSYEDKQTTAFNAWFDGVRGKLSGDVATNLQNQIDELDTRVDGFSTHNTVFSADGKTITETYGDKKIVTNFVSDTIIKQILYENNVLIKTKTITFTGDGTQIKEEVQ